MKQPADITSDRIRLDGRAAGAARAAGLAGVVALLAALVLALFGPAEFLRAYVMNYAFVVSLVLGALFFVIVQHLTRAGWSVTVRRLAEDVTVAVPVLALLALPIVVMLLAGGRAVHEVYPWTDAQAVAHDEVLRAKQGYLNVPFFVIRLVACLVIWSIIAHFFYTTSVRQDETGDPALTANMQARSAAAIIVYAITLTFFSFDLLMSLDPHWFSTIYGVYYFAGAAVGFFALLALMMGVLNRRGFATRSITVDHYHDVGKLVFAFVVFWAYIAFSQYMLIWYGNIPEETSWYVLRQERPWLVISLILLLGHFFVPFVALISRHPKRRPHVLVWGAAWVLVMHWFDVFYLAMPHETHAGGPAGLGGLDVLQCAASLVGIGGVATWAVLTRMNRAALVPLRDPRLGEALEFENI